MMPTDASWAASPRFLPASKATACQKFASGRSLVRLTSAEKAGDMGHGKKIGPAQTVKAAARSSSRKTCAPIAKTPGQATIHVHEGPKALSFVSFWPLHLHFLPFLTWTKNLFIKFSLFAFGFSCPFILAVSASFPFIYSF